MNTSAFKQTIVLSFVIWATPILGQSVDVTIKAHLINDSLVTSYYITDTSEGRWKLTEPVSSVAFIDYLQQGIERLPSEKHNVLIYIHGYLGNTNSFAESSNHILHQSIYDQPSNKFGIIINCQWESHINYLENYELAPYFAKRINEGLNHTFPKLHHSQLAILLHSMGHRIYDEMVMQPDCPVAAPDIFISCAGDISSDTYSLAQYDNMNNHCTSQHFFMHRDDKTLSIANLAKPYPRIGIFGPASNHAARDNVHVYDLTAIDDYETVPGSMSLHRYFYDSPTARGVLLSILGE